MITLAKAVIPINGVFSGQLYTSIQDYERVIRFVNIIHDYNKWQPLYYLSLIHI